MALSEFGCEMFLVGAWWGISLVLSSNELRKQSDHINQFISLWACSSFQMCKAMMTHTSAVISNDKVTVHTWKSCIAIYGMCGLGCKKALSWNWEGYSLLFWHKWTFHLVVFTIMSRQDYSLSLEMVKGEAMDAWAAKRRDSDSLFSSQTI